MILGIDAGLTGGLALVSKDGVLIEPMPTIDGVLHLVELRRWLTAHRTQIEEAWLEKVAPMPKNGSISCFKLGDTFGALKAMLTALDIPFQMVTPQKWQKAMHAGVEGVNTKARSCIAAARLFPAVDFRPTQRCRKPHEGMVEAALIGLYGMRQKGQI